MLATSKLITPPPPVSSAFPTTTTAKLLTSNCLAELKSSIASFKMLGKFDVLVLSCGHF
jgi:hypothetical protein